MSRVVLDAAHFDRKAREWDANPVFRERAERIAAAIRTHIPLDRGMRALDYGCGTGLLSFPLQDMLGEITLMDTSPGMLAVLQEKIEAQGHIHMRVIQGELSATNLPQGGFDLIYSSMTLHHIPDTRAILQRFHQLLRPGGWLAIADLDREDGSFHGPEVEVHHGFDRDDLARLAEDVGLREVRFDTVFSIDKHTPNGSRSYPVFLMTARRLEHRERQDARMG